MGLLVDMINVGEGDSCLLSIDGPQGEQNVLIDAGLPDKGATVLDYINQHTSGNLSMVIATHLDEDHIGGLETVMRGARFLRNAEFVLNVPPALKTHWPSRRRDLERYGSVKRVKRVMSALDSVRSLCTLANQRGLIQSEALQGRSWHYGGVTITVLNPTASRLASAWEDSRLDTYIQSGWEQGFVEAIESLSEAPETSPENDSSIVLDVNYNGENCALLASDAGAAVLREVTAGKRYRILKVPHHGSKTGLDEDLVKQLNPRYAFVPVGQNSFGHPCIEILDMLRNRGAITYCGVKTANCRRECAFKGGHVSFPVGRTLRDGWTTIDSTLCRNNHQTAAARGQ